ncbi:hypothetical protein [Marinobacterium rhizophilum]|uniref:Uncharacterized protein n=1 Tax=Marinobacterium rhizophilum TaxID=420402 RepID=A0ABY5HGM6_9GAMM|nr:hypothetical protein [Marinobacterium rhizophilum]UTW11518.1 hypothetical protein KDW95_20045 [Marinobacterium rhizophilum]
MIVGNMRGKAFALPLGPLGYPGRYRWLFILLCYLFCALQVFASDPENQPLPEVLNLQRGQTVSLQGTAIEVTAIAIKGPQEDCHDCPLGALLRLRMGNQEETVKYRFSGNMPEQAHRKARRKRVFGYVFTVTSINADSITLDVMPDAGIPEKTMGREREEK